MFISIFWDYNYDGEVGFDFSYFFSDKDRTKIKPIYESFRKVDEVSMWFDTLSKNLHQLELIKKGSIFVKMLVVEGKECENIERYTNSTYFQSGIDTIYSDPEEYFAFSHKTINNLSDLKIK